MSNDNPLLSTIEQAAKKHGAEASRHKLLHRSLWGASSIVSVLVAIATAFDFSLLNFPSKNIATLFAIILPMVTSYIVLRSPEKLWIHEINIRNQLLDLHTELNLLIKRNAEYDPAVFEKRYLAIMATANKKWIEIKEG
jgi:ABC-type spermidine/putrescine transport system permease subunit I